MSAPLCTHARSFCSSASAVAFTLTVAAPPTGVVVLPLVTAAVLLLAAGAAALSLWHSGAQLLVHFVSMNAGFLTHSPFLAHMPHFGCLSTHFAVLAAGTCFPLSLTVLLASFPVCASAGFATVGISVGAIVGEAVRGVLSVRVTVGADVEVGAGVGAVVGETDGTGVDVGGSVGTDVGFGGVGAGYPSIRRRLYIFLSLFDASNDLLAVCFVCCCKMISAALSEVTSTDGSVTIRSTRYVTTRPTKMNTNGMPAHTL